MQVFSAVTEAAVVALAFNPSTWDGETGRSL